MFTWLQTTRILMLAVTMSLSLGVVAHAGVQAGLQSSVALEKAIFGFPPGDNDTPTNPIVQQNDDFGLAVCDSPSTVSSDSNLALGDGLVLNLSTVVCWVSEPTVAGHPPGMPQELLKIPIAG